MRLRWAQDAPRTSQASSDSSTPAPRASPVSPPRRRARTIDAAGPGDQRARRHRRSREPEQEPGEDEQDGEPDRSGGAGERGEKRRAEALAGRGRANTRPDEQRGESTDRRSKQQDRAPGGGRSARQGRAGNQEAQHEPERAEDADAAVSHDGQPALRIHARRARRGNRRARRGECLPWTPSRPPRPVRADKRGGTTAASTRSASISPPPSASPTAGNHHAARPSAPGPAASRPGTGTMVKKRTARTSEAIHLARPVTRALRRAGRGCGAAETRAAWTRRRRGA